MREPVVVTSTPPQSTAFLTERECGGDFPDSILHGACAPLAGVVFPGHRPPPRLGRCAPTAVHRVPHGTVGHTPSVGRVTVSGSHPPLGSSTDPASS
ncbi:hypothetical protein DSY14_16500 [Nocardiopsis sp. MG754419]|nr:hypothetical protein [Nocardiopsis sp. MG754419]